MIIINGLRDGLISCWCCPHAMRSRVYVTVGCPSICLSHLSTAAVAACGWFAAERPACRRYRLQVRAPAPRTSYRSISAAGARAQQKMRVASCWEPMDEAQQRVVFCVVLNRIMNFWWCTKRQRMSLFTLYWQSVPKTPVNANTAINLSISVLETFVIIALYKSTFTIPYHAIKQ